MDRKFLRRTDLLVSIMLGVIVFLYFYSIPAPDFVISAEEIEKYIPEGYSYPDDLPDNITYSVGKAYDWYVIEFWYHWGYDGEVIKDDWEPVILYINKDGVDAVAHRVHYSWRVDYNPVMADDRPVVNFMYKYHTPLINRQLPGTVKIDMKPVPGKPENIDLNWVIWIGSSPYDSALTSAVVYSILISLLSYIGTSVARRYYG